MRVIGFIAAIGLAVIALSYSMQRPGIDGETLSKSSQELVQVFEEPDSIPVSEGIVDTSQAEDRLVVSNVDSDSESASAITEFLANGGAKVVPYSSISEESWREIYRERRKLGHFRLEDIALAGYDSYDKETVIGLAETGDALAEFIVVSSVSDYPVDLRREVALSSAMNGRTFGLFAFGTEIFDTVATEAHLAGLPDSTALFADLPESQIDRLVEGFGMMNAALRLGDTMPVGDGSAFQTARNVLSPDQLSASAEYATRLVDAVRQQRVDIQP